MKRILLFISLFGLITMSNINAQSEVIIDENFQGWEATELSDPADCESSLTHAKNITQELTLKTTSGDVQINADMINCGINPACSTKKTPTTEGVTEGYVSLGKFIEDPLGEHDTIGEMIFGPIANVEKIVFAHSATGTGRGIRLYTSTDGTNWDRVGTDEFADGDTQYGFVREVTIDLSDIYIRFTSGIRLSDTTTQYSRLHNMTVYGVPGAPPVGINNIKSTASNFVIQMQGNIFKLNGNYLSVKVYNTLGSQVDIEFTKESQTFVLNSTVKGIYIVRATDTKGKEYIQKIYKQ